ncbi:AraC family transcriptional regulator [Bradyrhizobium sp. Arg237L]|uniref:helix-turn-helix domain-containing protein n=1 Tax=Bradyrhizobium sp. Arg237L TaxID=3003352 RepID=UPI00249E1340|nr:AraC family transcriptional regulator [Bradyrhizobium sp. Arg237L]MDI4233522.1 AraC family transcriptional regulator [Bradyrhizobium sp. Arg237L]
MALTPMIGEGELRITDEIRSESPDTCSWLDGAIVFDHRRWSCRDAELTWTAPSHLIVLTHTGKTARTRISCSGELVYDGRDRPGALSFIPAGVERSGSYCEPDLVYSALWLDHARFGCERSAETLPILVNRADAVIAALLTALHNDVAFGSKPDTAYVEHLAAIAMHRIMALDGGKPRPSTHGALGKATLRRIEAYIEEHLGGEIRLSDLAAIADMEIDSFARRFRTATGMAPYAFVIARRIRRAEQLLADSDHELALIAARLGFSSQSHFTTAFKRERGMTPRAYRQQLFS